MNKTKLCRYTVKNESGCWLWIRSKHKQGYGHCRSKGKYELAHRVAWRLYKGPIPEGKVVCHKCDVTCCCNPWHMFLGTQKDNMSDANAKGRLKNRSMGKRRNKLTYDQVQEIKNLSAEGVTRKDLQARYQVGQTCIAKILTGVSWKRNWTEEL